MNKEDLILISVDDHIAEPADMFDAHVPDRSTRSRPRVSCTRPTASSSGTTATSAAGTWASTPSPASRREMYNVDASRYDEMRPGCFNVDERIRDMNAGGQLAGPELPELHRILRPGAQPGARP